MSNCTHTSLIIVLSSVATYFLNTFVAKTVIKVLPHAQAKQQLRRSMTGSKNLRATTRRVQILLTLNLLILLSPPHDRVTISKAKNFLVESEVSIRVSGVSDSVPIIYNNQRHYY